MTYAALMSDDRVRQTEALDARQVRNNAGGFVFALDKWARLDRFLVLGSDAPTYYQSARKLTRENAASVVECWTEDAARTAARIVEISDSGRAPKVGPVLFALALGDMHGDVRVRQAALAAVPAVCRTASHLMEFVSTVRDLGRGWGRATKRIVRDWYENRAVEDLGYQMAKYRSRNGYDHSRLIKVSHPAAADGDEGRVALYRWAIGKEVDTRALPDFVRGHLAAMATENVRDLVALVDRHRLTWEAVPTWALKEADVWKALLPNLPLKALLRNLSTLSSVGLTRPLSAEVSMIEDRFADAEAIRKSRLHPYAILQALAVYRSGRSVKGERTWTVNQRIVDALDGAFYLAFANVVPTGKRHLLALDVSGSMGTALIGGTVSAREGSAAMAMVTARTEKAHAFVGFSDGITDLDISPRMRLDETIRRISGLPFQSTDCGLPMRHALDKGIEVDVFVIYTDSETYAGPVHPTVALRRYRKETGIDAKLIVVGMTATGFSIADPDDAGMLDVVGFDAGAVSVMADFVRA